MHVDADALVIGAGPAGAATAIWLAAAGWRVILVEQHAYPRQKVCGGCIPAGSLSLLDALGVGAAVRETAGAELRLLGWIGRRATVVAQFPPCIEGGDRYGRAVDRDRLDALLLERARGVGVEVLQPATVCGVHGGPGRFSCQIAPPAHGRRRAPDGARGEHTRQVRVVIDAHGSWQPSPSRTGGADSPRIARTAKRGSDLFAFKASFRDSALAPGLLALISVAGGYGGIVANGRRTTLACCIRRDRLPACRAGLPGVVAGTAVGAYLGRSCSGLRDLLDPARSDGHWLSVGPIRPGIRVGVDADIFQVGNAAGEAHPLIGEGISIALQSAGLLTDHLLTESVARFDRRRTQELNRRYAVSWRDAFAMRLRVAAWYAHAAMHPAYATPAQLLMLRWPHLLTRTARWAGKTRRPIVRTASTEVNP
jgi:flavin-dependent dehydrogenase